MKRIIVIAPIIFLQITLLFSQSDSISVPEWYTKPPQKEGFIYGIGRASNSDMVTAERIARINAVSDLVKKKNNIFYSFVTTCDSVLGKNSKSVETIKKISIECSGTLTFVIDKDKKMFTTNSGYAFYCMVEQKTDEAIKVFKQKIKSDTEIKQLLKEKKLLLKKLDEIK